MHVTWDTHPDCGAASFASATGDAIGDAVLQCCGAAVLPGSAVPLCRAEMSVLDGSWRAGSFRPRLNSICVWISHPPRNRTLPMQRVPATRPVLDVPASANIENYGRSGNGSSWLGMLLGLSIPKPSL